MTPETLWIVVAVVAAVLLIALVLGLALRRRRRISLRETEELGGDTPDTPPPPPPPPPRRGGTYRVDSGFTFSAGTDTASRPTDAPVTRPDRDAPPPASRQAAAGRAPTSDAPITGDPAAGTGPAGSGPAGPGTVERVPTTGATDVGPATTRPDTGTAPAVPDTAAPNGAAPDTAVPDVAPPGGVADDRPGSGAVVIDTADTVVPDSPPRSTNGVAPTAPPLIPDASPPPVAPIPAAPPPPTPADSAPAPEAAPEAAPKAAPAPEIEPIEPPAGRLERLRGRLARSRSSFGQGLLGLLGAGELDEESWEDVEATLLQADLGPEMTMELVETLRTELAARAVRTPAQAKTLLRQVLTDALRPDLDRAVRALPHDGRPAVLLIVGVNGTGKTTTTGKLARVLVAGGHHVVLGAADTFRAAAAEQLVTWGERAGATVVRGPEGADPASVAFDAVKQGTDEGADAVLLDTAGRLHTKTGLMDELGKIKRVVSRQAEVDEVLLVLDATTGQNGLTQARVFGDVVNVTGIALTKLDGTAKGGIVFRVQRELGVPVKLVGLGEGPDDLAPFVPAAFVDALLD